MHFFLSYRGTLRDETEYGTGGGLTPGGQSTSMTRANWLMAATFSNS